MMSNGVCPTQSLIVPLDPEKVGTKWEQKPVCPFEKLLGYLEILGSSSLSNANEK